MNNLVTIIESSKASFLDKAAKMQTNLEYTVEASFAIQAVSKNSHTQKIALGNPGSLKSAMINLGAIGLSLNPAEANAYLVPRDNEICLDISYRGLIRLATEAGAIDWCQAEIVYSSDTFEYTGVGEKPVHKSNPFGERGEMVGVYCVAKTTGGDFLTTTMDMNEIKKIQSASKGAASKYSPWVNYFTEMAKKAVIKRGSKTWPKTAGSRLAEAISVLNEHEGVDFGASKEQLEYYEQLVKNDDALGAYCFYQSLEIEVQANLSSQYVKKYAEDRGIGKLKAKLKELHENGKAMAFDYRDSINDTSDESEIDELISELSEDDFKYIYSILSPEAQARLNNIHKEAA